MATVRSGDKAVLMVVDVQVGVVKDAWHRDEVVSNIAKAVVRAREAGTPVIWVQHENEELQRDSEAWQWAPELKPAAGEVLVHKRFNSAFEQTAIDATLAANGATRIVLAGAQTNWCIRATAYAALERGYDLTLLEDAHTTSSMDLDDGTRIDAAAIVHELNIAVQWLEYPGRRNSVATATNVNFSQAVV